MCNTGDYNQENEMKEKKRNLNHVKRTYEILNAGQLADSISIYIFVNEKTWILIDVLLKVDFLKMQLRISQHWFR